MLLLSRYTRCLTILEENFVTNYDTVHAAQCSELFKKLPKLKKHTSAENFVSAFARLFWRLFSLLTHYNESHRKSSQCNLILTLVLNIKNKSRESSLAYSETAFFLFCLFSFDGESRIRTFGCSQKIWGEIVRIALKLFEHLLFWRSRLTVMDYLT